MDFIVNHNFGNYVYVVVVPNYDDVFLDEPEQDVFNVLMVTKHLFIKQASFVLDNCIVNYVKNKIDLSKDAKHVV